VHDGLKRSVPFVSFHVGPEHDQAGRCYALLVTLQTARPATCRCPSFPLGHYRNTSPVDRPFSLLGLMAIRPPIPSPTRRVFPPQTSTHVAS
jgi:hypothetical protein